MMFRTADRSWDRKLAPYAGLLGWILILCCVVFSCVGCGGTDGVSMTMSQFDVWPIPPKGKQLPAPRSLYADESDNVYCLDNAGRVLIYSPDGSLKAQWDMPASEIGRPEGVWKLLDGRIAVADTHYHRIVIFTADLTGEVSHMFGTKGQGPGQFIFPVAVTQDPDGFLYVGEYGEKQRIQKFTVDGTFVTEFGEHGTGPGEFQSPRKILWRDGTVYVVDAFNNRLQVFSDDGVFQRIVELPEGAEPLKFPYDIKFDAKGRLFVIENKAGRLTILNPDGTIWGRFGRPSRGLDGFFNPWALAVLSDGRILVADTGNHRLVELTP